MEDTVRSQGENVVSLGRHRAVAPDQQDHAAILGLIEELWNTFAVEASVEKILSDEGDVSFCVTIGSTDYLVLPTERPGYYNTFRVELDGSITSRLENVPATRCLTYKHA